VKSLLLSLVALASTLAWSPREVSAPTRPEDPPLDCFLCGIDVRLHAAVLSSATSLNARVALRALSAFYG
jgi:hypothetical protein